MYKYLILTVLAVLSYVTGYSQSQKKRILVFSKTTGYVHASIPAGKDAIIQLAKQDRFIADTSSDASVFNPVNLEKYGAVVFLSTSGDILNQEQQRAFEEFVRKGGGYVGIHGASATEYEWPWYGRLVGAIFNGHPEIQQATFRVEDKTSRATRHLPARWILKEELYNFKSISPAIRVLISVDESSYSGGTNGNFHPMSWFHEFEGGRSFYTALAHGDERFSDKLFLKHLLAGIRYAMGAIRL